MAANCSADITRVINHLDSVLTFGSPHEVAKLKAQFGLEDVEHNDDFAVYVTPSYFHVSTDQLQPACKRPIPVAVEQLLHRLLWLLPILRRH